MTATHQEPAATDDLGRSPASEALRRGARAHPDMPAIEVDERTVSYAEFDAMVDGLAQRLLDDLGNDHPFVMMRINDPVAMGTASLAIQRAGMASVPVDPTAPIERVEAVIREIQPALLLGDVDGDAGALSVRVEHPLDYAAVPPADGVFGEPGELAAVVFTSGSTGVPKGIMHSVEEQASAARLFRQLADEFGEGSRRCGAIAAGTIGLSDASIHSAITLDGTYIAYEIRKRGLTDFGSWLRDKRISTIALVPTIWRFLAPTLAADEMFPDMRLMVYAGETSTWEDVAELRRHLPDSARISNILAQTEVMISRFDIYADTPLGTGPLPAGTVFPDRVVTIVDVDGNPVPQGEPGEIEVETTSCAVGYWKMPDATARVFTTLPDGRRRVRTGDRGRILADGTLQHLGRLDHVVKVAGNRIELGEIESALRVIAGVADAAATVYTSANDENRLMAFAVPAPGVTLHPALLRAALTRQLPGSMVPHVIRVLDELPRLAGGKVDRLQLPTQRVSDLEPAQPRLADLTDTEAGLLEIWRDVLDLEEIGMEDDFFALGGDSLRAARLFADLESRMGIDRPVSLIIEAPTVSALAASLDADDAWQALVPLRVEGSKPPLIVVHDGFGDVFYAARLIPQLGEDQPVYGIRPRAVNGMLPPESTLEEVARSYVVEVRRFRPHGPYLLYGFSLGGSIAFEMAKQLRQAGEEVALLALGDSTAPFPGLLGRPPSFGIRARNRVAQLRAMPRREALERVGWLTERQLRHTAVLARRALGRRVGNLAPPPEEQLERLIQSGANIPQELRGLFVFRVYISMLLTYAPTDRFDGPILLLRAQSRDERPDRGWSDYVTGHITAVDVDTDHDLLHSGDAAQVVGEALRAHIDDVLSQS